MPIDLTARVHFNMNDNVRVTLTDAGLECAQKMAHVQHSLKGRVLTTQLWCLMQDFGPLTHMGGPTLFEDQRLDLVDVQTIE